MGHKIRPMHAAVPPAHLAERPSHWAFAIRPPANMPFPVDLFTGTEEITLPFGTHLHVRSSIARAESVVVTREDGHALYDTVVGIARPSVTAAIYRVRKKRVEVGVVIMKRHIGMIPGLRALADADGFVDCAEPPGGLIEDDADHDYLTDIPSLAVLRATARREIEEEFGHLPIRSITVMRHPLASLGMARGNVYQAFIEVDPKAKPRLARPEDAEQILGRRFMPLEMVLRHCLEGVHRGIFWGRESTHTWKLLVTHLEQQARRAT